MPCENSCNLSSTFRISTSTGHRVEGRKCLPQKAAGHVVSHTPLGSATPLAGRNARRHDRHGGRRLDPGTQRRSSCCLLVHHRPDDPPDRSADRHDRLRPGEGTRIAEECGQGHAACRIGSRAKPTRRGNDAPVVAPREGDSSITSSQPCLCSGWSGWCASGVQTAHRIRNERRGIPVRPYLVQ